jgi:predicted peptidase
MRQLSLLCAALMMSMLVGCSARSIDWENTGAPKGTGFQTKQLQFEGNSQNYTVFVPWNYSPANHYPVVMFLHGVMEGGSDGRKCVTVGLGPEVNSRASTFPFIAVFPQSTSDWESDYHARLAIATLDQVLKDYPAGDRDRVFLTGLSNGGDGTWSIGTKYTDRFAGLVPMCSAANHDDAPKLTHIPIWAFHNSIDPFRNCGGIKSMCEKVNEAGGNAKFTEYGEFGHDCWTRAYSEGEVFTWMQSLRKGSGTVTKTITSAGKQ